MLQRREHTHKEPGANPEQLCAAPEGVWTPGFDDLEDFGPVGITQRGVAQVKVTKATKNPHLRGKPGLNLWSLLKKKPSQLNLFNAAFQSCLLNLLHSIFSSYLIV